MKKVFLIAFFVIMSVMCASCGGNKEAGNADEPTNAPVESSAETPPPQETPKPRQSTVIWGCAASEEQFTAEIGAAFTEKFPHIRIVARPYADDVLRGDFNEFLIRLAIADTFPDAMTVYGNLPSFISKGWLKELKFGETDAEFNALPKFLTQAGYFDGKLFALPQNARFTALKAQTAQTEENAPQGTIDAFLEEAEEATLSSRRVLADINGAAFLSPALFGGSAGFMGYNAANNRFDFQDGAWEKSIEFLKTLMFTPGFVQNPTIAALNSETEETAKIDLRRVLYTIEEIADFTQEGNFATLPTEDGSLALPVKTDFCVMFDVNRQRDEQDVFQFMRYMSYSADGVAARLAVDGAAAFIPVSADAAVKSIVMGDKRYNPSVVKMYVHLNNGFRVDLDAFIPNYAEIRDKYYLPALADVLTRGGDIAETAQRLDITMNDALRDANAALSAKINLLDSD